MTTFDARIEIVDHGFFGPRDEAPRDMVDGLFRFIEVDALTASVQFVRTNVSIAPDRLSHHHVVIWAHHPRAGDDFVGRTDGALRAAFPDVSVSFVRDATLLERGDVYDVNLEAWTSGTGSAHESVSAVCAAQCYGTLAVLERVTVRLDGTLYCALMQHGGSAWLASVSAMTDPSAEPGGAK